MSRSGLWAWLVGLTNLAWVLQEAGAQDQTMTALSNPNASGITVEEPGRFDLMDRSPPLPPENVDSAVLQRQNYRATSLLKQSVMRKPHLAMPDEAPLRQALAAAGVYEMDMNGEPCLWTWIDCRYNVQEGTLQVRSVYIDATQLSQPPRPGVLTPSWCDLSALEELGLLVFQSLSGNLHALANCTSLIRVRLFQNQVEGDVAALANLTSLDTLHLSNSRVSGDISKLAEATKLREVALDATGVFGDIASLAGNTGLAYLHVAFTAVHGDLCSLSTLQSLEGFSASSTRVTGDFACFSGFPQLASLELQRTGITGSMEKVSLAGSLRILDLQDTAVSGDVCAIPGDLTQVVLLGRTAVSGDISCFGWMPQLELLALDWTNVSGNIVSLDAAASLTFLNVSFTQVEGDFGQLCRLWQLTVADLGHSEVHLTLPLCEGLYKLQTLHAPNTVVHLGPSRSFVTVSLVSLNLNNCSLEGSLQRLLVGILGGCPMLSSVDLGNTNIQGQLNLATPLFNMLDNTYRIGPVLWLGSLMFLNLSATRVSSIVLADETCGRGLACRRPALRMLDLSQTKHLENLDPALLDQDSKTLLDLRGSTFKLSLADTSELDLARSELITIGVPRRGFECFGLDRRPFLLADSDTFAPEFLCRCLPGHWGTGATCSECPAGLHQNDSNKSSCKPCPNPLEQPNSMGTECETGPLGRTVNIYSASATLCMAVAMFLLYRSVLGVPIEDVRVESNAVIITTFPRHWVLPIFARYGLFTVWGSGHPELDGKALRVKVLSTHRLQVLGLQGSVESSMGWVRPVWFWGFLTHGVLFTPTAVLIVGLLVPWSIPNLTRIHHGFLVVGSVPVLLHMASEHLRGPSTRLEQRLRPYAKALRDANPVHEQCPRGRPRGVTVAQLAALHNHFKDLVVERNMYYVVSNIIKRLTRRQRLSYAEMAGPHEARWFVSHYWGTPFRHFVESIKGHAESSGDVDPWQDTSYWICSLANNQWLVEEEVGESWRESSFYLSLRGGVSGTVMVLDEEALPLTRVWCLFELLQTFILEQEEPDFQGLFLATPSGVLNYGAASADMAVNLAHRLASLRLQDAGTSVEKDRQEIFGLIRQQPGGFAAINTFVRERMQAALRNVQATFQQCVEGLLQSLDPQQEASPRSVGAASGASTRRSRRVPGGLGTPLVAGAGGFDKASSEASSRQVSPWHSHASSPKSALAPRLSQRQSANRSQNRLSRIDSVASGLSAFAGILRSFLPARTLKSEATKQVSNV